MQDKIRKLKAIKKLAEAGAPGEKEAAQHKLKTLCEKWGVSLEMLEERKEVKPEYKSPSQAAQASDYDELLRRHQAHNEYLRQHQQRQANYYAQMQQAAYYGQYRAQMANQAAYQRDYYYAKQEFNKPKEEEKEEPKKLRWWEKIIEAVVG